MQRYNSKYICIESKGNQTLLINRNIPLILFIFIKTFIMRKILLLGVSCLFAGSSLFAQDYAPKNWKFNEMNVGSAEEIFIKEMGATVWNCKAPFRLADDGNGGVGVSSAVGGDITGPGSNAFENITDADKAVLEEFYKSATIVDGGSENLLCFIGKDAENTYPGGVKCEKSLPNLTFWWLSGTDMPLGGNYRLTIDYRIIAKNAGSIKYTIATSSYDGIDNNTGLGSGGYREKEYTIDPAFNNYWIRTTLDFIIEDNTDADYKELPIVVKMFMSGINEQSVVLFRSFKLEKIDKIDENNVPGSQSVVNDFKDNPSSVEKAFENSTIVTTNNGSITVIDAKAPIEVYNTTGVLVKRVNNNATLINIPMEENGMFIVKSGDVVRKVVL